jgi:hypothetical protein
MPPRLPHARSEPDLARYNVTRQCARPLAWPEDSGAPVTVARASDFCWRGGEGLVFSGEHLPPSKNPTQSPRPGFAINKSAAHQQPPASDVADTPPSQQLVQNLLGAFRRVCAFRGRARAPWAADFRRARLLPPQKSSIGAERTPALLSGHTPILARTGCTLACKARECSKDGGRVCRREGEGARRSEGKRWTGKRLCSSSAQGLLDVSRLEPQHVQGSLSSVLCLALQ